MSDKYLLLRYFWVYSSLGHYIGSPVSRKVIKCRLINFALEVYPVHDETCDFLRDFFFFFFFLLLFLFVQLQKNSFIYFKLQFIYKRNVNIISVWKKTALHAHNLDSIVETTLFNVVSMLIHHSGPDQVSTTCPAVHSILKIALNYNIPYIFYTFFLGK